MLIAEAYVRLARAIDAHAPGFVEGHPGPKEWADPNPSEPADLKARAADLSDRVAAEVQDEGRRAFLLAQARAMHTMARLLAGEAMSFEEEVEGLFDVTPVATPEADFRAAHARLNDLLPGEGDLAEREARLQERVHVPVEVLLRVADVIVGELRSRTARLYGLPDGESFTVNLTSDKRWTAYNWPLGDLKSRVEINTDFPIHLPGLPSLLAHEGYPGHHAEHASKEARLARSRGWREFEVHLLNAPDSVVSEGIATRALEAVMDDAELEAWLAAELAPLAGVDADDARAYLRVERAREVLWRARQNAALLLLRDGRSEADAVAYLREFALLPQDQAEWTVRRLSTPFRGARMFTYTCGSDLVGRVLNGNAGREGFLRMLTEPVTPATLRSWA